MASSLRTIAPKHDMDAHARMLSPCQPYSSPIFPTPKRYESSLSSSGAAETPVAIARSDSCDGAISTTQRPSYASPTASSKPERDAESSSPGPRPYLARRKLTKIASPAFMLESTQIGCATAADSSYKQSSSSSAGLKLKLRGIQAALNEGTGSADNFEEALSTRKRTSFKAVFEVNSDTDSEIDILPPSRRNEKPSLQRPTARSTAPKTKKVKVCHASRDYYKDDSVFDAGDEDSSPTASPDSDLILSSNVLKRSERMLDPNNPEHAKLIAAAPKAGSEYYDSDADELPGNVKDTGKPHLFRNVKWGSLATDYTDPSVFTTEPEFTQFVPGRFERLPNNTAYDQKHKLIIRLTDSSHRQRIFTNPPPVDWNNQEAITALNKRTVQQIRRNTAVRFRVVVEPYVEVERQWILAHLTDGKPVGGWRGFVEQFNREFAGKIVRGAKDKRPERSHSSLTKEVERFGEVYARGAVPKTGGKAKARVVKRWRGGRNRETESWDEVRWNEVVGELDMDKFSG